jgi:hypothetical protein
MLHHGKIGYEDESWMPSGGVWYQWCWNFGFCYQRVSLVTSPCHYFRLIGAFLFLSFKWGDCLSHLVTFNLRNCLTDIDRIWYWETYAEACRENLIFVHWGSILAPTSHEAQTKLLKFLRYGLSYRMFNTWLTYSLCHFLKRHLQSFADLWPPLMDFSIYI